MCWKFGFVFYPQLHGLQLLELLCTSSLCLAGNVTSLVTALCCAGLPRLNASPIDSLALVLASRAVIKCGGPGAGGPPPPATMNLPPPPPPNPNFRGK